MFEKFTGFNQSFKPIVTITKTGLICFNKGAYNRYCIQHNTYAVLYYDSDVKSIAIQLTANEDEGMIKLRKRQHGSDISAVSFLDYYEIDYKETRQYQPKKSKIETADGSVEAVVIENVPNTEGVMPF